MADLAASNLTYTKLSEEMNHGGRVVRRFAITTAAGEYPTGGLPLDNSAMGYPTVLERLAILEQSEADVYQYGWDRSANTIKVLVDDGTSGVPAEHANATFTSPDQLIIEVSGY